MKAILTFPFFFLAVLVVGAQNSNPNYDKSLAKKLGADEYGMKQYVLVMLKTGENTSASKEETEKAFRGHLDNISKMAKEGKLIVAGPMGKNDKNYRGIFIFDVATIDEAKSLVMTDPAIKAKLLDAEMYEWYGSAALVEYLPASDKIWKIEP